MERFWEPDPEIGDMFVLICSNRKASLGVDISEVLRITEDGGLRRSERSVGSGLSSTRKFERPIEVASKTGSVSSEMS